MSFLTKLLSIFSRKKGLDKASSTRVFSKLSTTRSGKGPVAHTQTISERDGSDEKSPGESAERAPRILYKPDKVTVDQRTMIMNRDKLFQKPGIHPSAKKCNDREDTAAFDSERRGPLFLDEDVPPTQALSIEDVAAAVGLPPKVDEQRITPPTQYSLAENEPVEIVPPGPKIAGTAERSKNASPKSLPQKTAMVPDSPPVKATQGQTENTDTDLGETRKTRIAQLKYSPESQQIIALTEKRFPELAPFMENLLFWIERNLGEGLLTQSVQQIYAADIDFELEPADFLLRVLQGIQINNLGPLFKIVYLRAEQFLSADLTESILETVSSFESKIRTLHLVEIFPWQKKRSIMRRILDKVPVDSKPALFDLLEKSTREKTKERTIHRWLEIMLDEANYIESLDAKTRQELTRLSEEFRRSTAETQIFNVNMEQMMAKAEHDNRVLKLHDYLVESIRDLQDRKGRLIEDLFPLLDMLEMPALDELYATIYKETEIDVYATLKYLLASHSADTVKRSPILQEMLVWRDELRMKEALKRMYFVSRAYKHDLLIKSLLILGCLSENDEISYTKKIKKINVLYNFNLDQHLLDHPFNPNSTKATTPGSVKYTLQFEEKNGGKKLREEMILYRGGTILAKMIIPLEDQPIPETQSRSMKKNVNYVQRCAFALETMINFYESMTEITREIRQNNPNIWDRQGIHSLKEMIGNKQDQLLQIDSDEFGLSSIEGQSYPGMAYIVAKLVDDVYLPLNRYVLRILKIEHSENGL